MNAGLLLDTSALKAYMRGSIDVGAQIADASSMNLATIVPALCFAQAYRESNRDSFHMLDVLGANPAVMVAPLEQGHCSVLGGWSRTLGSLDLAHAAVEAAANALVPIMTAHRDLVTRILPAEWPIIDI